MAKLPTLDPTRSGSDGEGTGNNRHLAFPPFAPPPQRKSTVSLERSAEVLGTLQEISRATPDLDGCRQLLECVSGELRAEQAVLILCNPLTRELEFVVHNQDPAFAQLYADHYADLDPTGLPDYIRGKNPLCARAPAYSVSDLMEVIDYSALVSTEFYNDFMKSAKIHYDLVAFVSPHSFARGALCLHRARRRSPFSAEEVAVLDIVAPFVGNHLERMFSASLRSSLPVAEGKGVIVCDTRGRVLFCNDTARLLCSPLGHGRIRRGLLAEACFVGYTLNSPESLAESCDVGVAFKDVALEHGERGRVFTIESRHGLESRWDEPLKERFSLTDREIEVLNRLIAGGSNREISQSLFIAECTVKKHIQSISAKVGAHTRTSIAHAVRQELGLSL
jgi:DNA-binding CsgD family transcriptional regulator